MTKQSSGTVKVLSNPLSGQELRIIAHGGYSYGALIIEASDAGPSRRPPEHFHPHQDEHMEVLAGTLTICRNGQTERLRPGQLVFIPRGTAHTVWNEGPEPVRWRWETRPALHTEELLTINCCLAREGLTGPTSVSKPLHLASLLTRYADEIQLAALSPMHRKLLRMLAFVANALGYAAQHRRYLSPQE